MSAAGAARATGGLLACAWLALGPTAQALDAARSGGASGAAGRSLSSAGVGASGEVKLDYPLGAVTAHYDSRSMAWSVGRTPAVVRSSRFGTPAWDGSDVFELDGMALACATQCSATGSGVTREYHASRETGARIRYVNPGTSGSYWEVTHDGEVQIYGVRALSGTSYGGVVERQSCASTPRSCVTSGTVQSVDGGLNPQSWLLATSEGRAGKVRTAWRYTRDVESPWSARAGFNEGAPYLLSVSSSTEKSTSSGSIANDSVTEVVWERVPQSSSDATVKAAFSFASGTFLGSAHRVAAVNVYGAGTSGRPPASAVASDPTSEPLMRYRLTYDDASSWPGGSHRVTEIVAEVPNRSTSAVGDWLAEVDRGAGASSRNALYAFGYAPAPSTRVVGAATDASKWVHMGKVHSLRMYWEESGETWTDVGDGDADGYPDQYARESDTDLSVGLGSRDWDGDGETVDMAWLRGGDASHAWVPYHSEEDESRVRSESDASRGEVIYDTGPDANGDGWEDLFKRGANGDLYVKYNTREAPGTAGGPYANAYSKYHEVGEPSSVEVHGSSATGSVDRALGNVNGGPLDLVSAEAVGSDFRNGDGDADDLIAAIGTGSETNGTTFQPVFVTLLNGKDPSGKAALVSRSDDDGDTHQQFGVDVNGDGLGDRLVTEAEYGQDVDGDGESKSLLVQYGTGGLLTPAEVFIGWVPGTFGSKGVLVSSGRKRSTSSDECWRNQVLSAIGEFDGTPPVDLLVSEQLVGDQSGDGDSNDLVLYPGRSMGSIDLASSPVVFLRDEDLGPSLAGDPVPIVDVVRQKVRTMRSCHNGVDVCEDFDHYEHTDLQVMSYDGTPGLLASERVLGRYSAHAASACVTSAMMDRYWNLSQGESAVGLDDEWVDLNGDGDHNGLEMLRGNASPAGKLVQVTEASGATTEYGYAKLDRTYTSRNAHYPQTEWVLSTVTQRDGYGRTWTTSYAYEGGAYDWSSHSDLGFAKVIVTNPDGTTEVQHYLQSEPFVGVMDEVVGLDENGKIRSRWTQTLAELCSRETSDGSSPVHPAVAGLYGCDVTQSYPSYPKHVNGTVSVAVVRTVRTDSWSANGTVGLTSSGAVPSSIGAESRTAMAWEYDAYGHVVTSKAYGSVDPVSGNDLDVDRVDEETTWSWDLSNWWFLPTEVRTYALQATGPSDWVGTRAQVGRRTATYSSTTGLLTQARVYRGASDSSGLATTYTYTSGSGAVSTVTDALGVKTENTWDSTFRLHLLATTVTHPSSSRSFTTTYTYDPLWRSTSSTDPNGWTTQRAYDDFGAVVAEAGPGDSLSSPTVKYLYDHDGTLPMVQGTAVRDKSADGWQWSYTWRNGFGEVVAQQTEQGAGGDTAAKYRTQYTWTREGVGDHAPYVEQQVQAYTAPSLEPRLALDGSFSPPSVPASGVSTAVRYYSPTGLTGTAYAGAAYAGEVTVTTPPSGHARRALVFRNAAQVWAVQVDALGRRAERYAIPSLRQSWIRELDAAGAVVAETTTFASPGESRVTDAAGNVTTSTFDWLGQPLTTSDPDTGTWTYGYDGTTGLRTSQTNGMGTSSFGYDAFGRPLTTTYADGSTARVYWDGDDDGNGTIDADRTGARLLGAVSKVVQGAVSTVNAGYGAAGEPLGATRTIGAVTKAMGYGGYDELHRMTQMSYPGLSSPVTLTYEENEHRLATMTHPSLGALLSGMTQDAWGRATAVQHGNGTQTTYLYGGASTDFRLQQIDGPDVGSDPNTSAFTYDAVGHLTRVDSSADRDRDYAYDTLDRLVAVANPGAAIPAEEFTYDAIGNLTSKKTGSGSAMAYTYAASASGVAPKHAPLTQGDWHYGYDPAGNQIARHKRVKGATSGDVWSDDAQRLVFDAAGRLALVSAGHHPGATGYWDLGAGGGTAAPDLAGGVDAVLTGRPAWESSGEVTLDGVDDGIATASTSDEPSGNSARTLSAWVKVQSVSALAADGLSAVVGYGGASSGYVGLAVGTDGKLRWVVDGVVGATSSGASVRAGEWTHVAATYATDKTVTFYVNGEAAGTATLASTLSTAASGPVTIGCLRAGVHCLKDTSLAQVGIFGRVLSADELAGLASERASGAVGAWDFDDAMGSTAAGMTSSSADSGHYGPATAASASVTPSWTGGALGGAADFDGTDDIVSVATASGPTALNAGDFTASAWIWIDGFRSDGGGMRIVNDDGNNNGWGLVARGASSSASVVRLFLRGASPESLDTSAGTLESGRWNHVVGIRSGNTRKIYVNGVLKASDTFTGTVKSDSGALSIGGDTNETAFFNGKIDQVELYDRVVSEKVLQAKAARSPRGASHFWALGEGSGTTTADAGQQTGSAASLVGDVAWTPGVIGRGLSFDASGTSVTLNHQLSGAAGSLTGLTASAYVRTAKSSTSWYGNYGVLDYDRSNWFTLTVTGSGYPSLWTTASSGSRQECTATASDTTPLNDGEWHHLAATYDGVDVVLYADGAKVKTCANQQQGLSLGTGTAVTGRVGVGKVNDSLGDRRFEGDIDEVRFDTRALSASQIAALAHRSQRVRMAYDATGERVFKDANGSRTYVFFPDYEVREGVEVRRYGAARAEEADGRLIWVVPDHLGTPAAVTDSTGTAVRYEARTAYGEASQSVVLDATSPAPTGGFTGQPEDPETGLVYLHARYYDPAQGQFVSADDVTPPGPLGLNRYAYAFDRPSELTDPDGHCPVCLAILIGGLVSGAVEGAAVGHDGKLTEAEGWELALAVGFGAASAPCGPMQGAALGGVSSMIGTMIVEHEGGPSDRSGRAERIILATLAGTAGGAVGGWANGAMAPPMRAGVAHQLPHLADAGDGRVWMNPGDTFEDSSIHGVQFRAHTRLDSEWAHTMAFAWRNLRSREVQPPGSNPRLDPGKLRRLIARVNPLDDEPEGQRPLVVGIAHRDELARNAPRGNHRVWVPRDGSRSFRVAVRGGPFDQEAQSQLEGQLAYGAARVHAMEADLGGGTWAGQLVDDLLRANDDWGLFALNQQYGGGHGADVGARRVFEEAAADDAWAVGSGARLRPYEVPGVAIPASWWPGAAGEALYQSLRAVAP